MAKPDDDFRKRLLSTFGVEAREHIRAISSGLIALEKTTAAGLQLEILEAIYREAHSLKGAARAVNLAEIEAICQALESVFAALKRQEIMPVSELFDALHQATDPLSTLLVAGEARPTAAEQSQIRTLVQRLEGIAKGSGVRGQGTEIRDQASTLDLERQSLVATPPSPTSGLVETVRISTTRLDSLLLRAEELLAAKLTASQRAADLREINAQVVPVLNVSDVLKSAVRASAAAVRRVATTIAPTAAPSKTVLVVEDSITARMLLKNLLEAAGYRVVTAVDGVDGLTQVRSGTVDIVISDVDMPRMNGFALTAKIRSDQKFADLPVVLVTALESREDRERGIEVGANAYLVKSSFDQSNLIEVMQRLV